ncbi:hypothetical protein J4061_004471 [Salmonella enterica]|nr:hypothetical protein [Salmonella enterica]
MARLTEQQKLDIAEGFKKGVSGVLIAAMIGTTKETVRKYKDYKPKPAKPPKVKFSVVTIARMVIDGLYIDEIAKEYGVSVSKTEVFYNKHLNEIMIETKRIRKGVVEQ